MNNRTSLGDLGYTWDANKNKTSESITGDMSGYGFTSARTTYVNEDLCFSSSLPPPASSLLVDIDANGTADVTFQYDALGRRVARSGTGGSEVYEQMDQQTIANYPVGGAATTPTFRYVYASYIDEPVVRKTAGTGGTLVYFHCNHQYSVTAITTSAGAIAERYAYTAYGQPTILDASGATLPTSNFSISTSYTGREWDAKLGLHHFRARWMSPSAGRFITRDPIGFEGGAFSIVEYCHSNPFVYVDPTGEQIRPFPALPWQPPSPPDPCLDGPPLPPSKCPYGETDRYGADFAMHDGNKNTGACKCDPHIMLHKFFGGGEPKENTGSCWARVEWPLSCVCKSMGDDSVANCVRGCLACIFKRKGNLAPDQKEHALCIDHCVPWYHKRTFYSKLDVTIHCCAKKYGVIVGPGTGGEPGPVTSPGQPVEFDCDGCGAGPTRRMNCNVTK